METKHKAYIIHDGMLMGEEFNGYILSAEAIESVKQQLNGVVIGKGFAPSDHGYQLEDVLGHVVRIYDDFVAIFHKPLDQRVMATMRPALSLFIVTDDEGDAPHVVTEVYGINGLALVGKEDGDLGYFEPYTKEIPVALLVRPTVTAVEGDHES